MDQGSMSIREFYYEMRCVWNELNLLKQSEIEAVVLHSIRKLRVKQRMNHFLMKLQHNFEGT